MLHGDWLDTKSTLPSPSAPSWFPGRPGPGRCFQRVRGWRVRASVRALIVAWRDRPVDDFLCGRRWQAVGRRSRGRLRRKSRNPSDARCSRRRAPHDPAPHVRALPFRASPRGQRLAAAFLDLMFEATPARLPSAAPSLGGARANSTPSFQRSLGAQAPHERCAHSSRPLARLALDPRDPARAPGPAPLPPRCASERRV